MPRDSMECGGTGYPCESVKTNGWGSWSGTVRGEGWVENGKRGTHQWQKSEEMMKNVSSSRQYFSSTRLMAVVSRPSCPTIRGTSLRLSRLKRESQSASSPSEAWGARCANSLCKDVSDVRQVHLQRVLVFVYVWRDSLEDTSGFELVEYCTRIGVNDMVFALWGWDQVRRNGVCAASANTRQRIRRRVVG